MATLNEDDRLSGNGYSKMIQLMKKYGYNKDINVEFGTVVTAPPEITIKLDQMNEPLDKDDLVIAEHLTKYKRTITIRKSAEQPSKISFNSSSISSSMQPAGYVAHTHVINSLGLNDVQNSFVFEHLEIEFENELKAGDRVAVISFDDDQSYFVIDKVVTY